MSGMGGWDGYVSVPDLGIDGLDDWALSEGVAPVPLFSDDSRSAAGVRWIEIDTGGELSLRDSNLRVVPPPGVDAFDWFAQIVKGQQQ